MVGQFHKNCDDRSVHNKEFRVSLSPIPLIAIRHMARHDILFLGQENSKKEWFLHYNLRFGHRFNNPDKISPSNQKLMELYLKAKERWKV